MKENESIQYSLGYQDGFLDAKKQFEKSQGDLNNAIRTIKTICQENNTCNTCPMNLNCNEQPAKWVEAKGGAE